MHLDDLVRSIRSVTRGSIHDYLTDPVDIPGPPLRRYTIAFFIQSVPFTADVVEGRSSLGGSESACLSVARALGRRGHDVHIFADQLDEAIVDRQPDPDDVLTWHHASELPSVLPFFHFDVFCSLRMPQVFSLRNPAKLTVLWCQDLLTGPGAATTGFLSQVDVLAFVSEFHRVQWQEKEPTLRNMEAWVVQNPIDPAGIPSLTRKKPYLIHTSRPERGGDALLHLWPEIRKAYPGLELHRCRYSSMYDAKGFGRVCEAFDQKFEALNRKVGGIVTLGELSKPDLYRAVSGALLQWYPTSQPYFAETNCIAATEAQACGTPMVADARGALPETLGPGAGVLIANPGGSEHWKTAGYRDATLEAIEGLLESPSAYAHAREQGFKKAAGAMADVEARAWEERIDDYFETRYQNHQLGILRRLLNDDDHGAAQVVADSLLRDPSIGFHGKANDTPQYREVEAAAQLCADVIAQRHATADDYSANAIQDPEIEAAQSGRFKVVADFILTQLGPRAGGPVRILDLACGNGSMVLKLASLLPQAEFYGVDYSPGVLKLASDVAERGGYADRAHFFPGYWDGEAGRWTSPELEEYCGQAYPQFDVVFCGEFLEHVLHPEHVIDDLERYCFPGWGVAVITTPCGPFAELMPDRVSKAGMKKGHVHDYTIRDIAHLFSTKASTWQYIPVGQSSKGSAVGYWLASLVRPDKAKASVPAPALDLDHKILTTRPYQRIDACLIVRDSADWLRACIRSLECCDRVLVYDTGSTDGTQDLARSLGAEVTEIVWPHDFSVARNASIARSLQGPDHPDGAEWVLWVDADERLDGGQRVRQYAHGGGPFNAYAIRQHHMHLDQEPYFDTPCRLFRTRPLAAHRPADLGKLPQFYGVVHEQPEIVMNKGLTPALMVTNVNFPHFGYYHGKIRRTKSLERNFPLLQKEIKGDGTHPPRTVAWAFLMRDLLQSVALYRDPAKGDELTAQDRSHLAHVIALYRQHGFGDPDSLLHEFTFGIYQQALLLLDITRHGGIEVAWAFGATRGPVKAPKPKAFLAMTIEEAEGLIQKRVRRWMAGLEGEKYRVAPYDPEVDDGVVGTVAPVLPFTPAEEVEGTGPVERDTVSDALPGPGPVAVESQPA